MVPLTAVQTTAAHTCHGRSSVMCTTNGVTTTRIRVDTAICVTASVVGLTLGAKNPVVMMCSA